MGLRSMDREGMTPIHVAAASGAKESILTILNTLGPEARKALLGMRVPGRGLATHLACESHAVAALEALLVKAKDCDIPVDAAAADDDDPRTPLHIAAEYAHTECVRVLIDMGADPLAVLPASYLEQFSIFPEIRARCACRLAPRCVMRNGDAARAAALFDSCLLQVVAPCLPAWRVPANAGRSSFAQHPEQRRGRGCGYRC